jgi:hypothetical protein
MFNSYLSLTPFDLQNCPIGFVFLTDSDARIFYNIVKSNKNAMSCELHASAHFLNNNYNNQTEATVSD